MKERWSFSVTQVGTCETFDDIPGVARLTDEQRKQLLKTTQIYATFNSEEFSRTVSISALKMKHQPKAKAEK